MGFRGCGDEAVGLRARDILREAGRVLVSVSRTLLALRE